MSRLSIFAAATVLSALAITPVVFAREHHRIHKVLQYSGTIHPGQAYAKPYWSYAAPRPTLHHDDTPSYDDPSKFGGGEALPVK
jgi:hypothetical protein